MFLQTIWYLATSRRRIKDKREGREANMKKRKRKKNRSSVSIPSLWYNDDSLPSPRMFTIIRGGRIHWNTRGWNGEMAWIVGRLRSSLHSSPILHPPLIVQTRRRGWIALFLHLACFYLTEAEERAAIKEPLSLRGGGGRGGGETMDWKGDVRGGWNEEKRGRGWEEKFGVKKTCCYCWGCWMVAWIDTVWWRWLSRIWLLFSRKIRWNQRRGDGKIDIIGIIKIVRSLIRQGEEKSGSRWNNGSISRIHRGSGEKEDEKWRIERGRLRLESKVFHRAVWLLPGDHILLSLRFLFLSKGGGVSTNPSLPLFQTFIPTFLKSYLQID